MLEISAAFVGNFRLSSFRKKKHRVHTVCLFVIVSFLTMVVHEKYQQPLWKKFFKMLLIFLMYQGKGKGKSIPRRPVQAQKITGS